MKRKEINTLNEAANKLQGMKNSCDFSTLHFENHRSRSHPHTDFSLYENKKKQYSRYFLKENQYFN